MHLSRQPLSGAAAPLARRVPCPHCRNLVVVLACQAGERIGCCHCLRGWTVPPVGARQAVAPVVRRKKSWWGFMAMVGGLWLASAGAVAAFDALRYHDESSLGQGRTRVYRMAFRAGARVDIDAHGNGDLSVQVRDGSGQVVGRGTGATATIAFIPAQSQAFQIRVANAARYRIDYVLGMTQR